MGFMQPFAERFAAYHVETESGTDVVPVDVCGTLDEDGATFVPKGKVIRDTPANVARLQPYIEGSKVYTIERKEGFYARLNASGYLDCTPWDGPHDTAEQAFAAVKDMYDVDDAGDPAHD